MKRLFGAGGTGEDRAGVSHAQQVGAHIDLRGIAQAARPQLHVFVAFARPDRHRRYCDGSCLCIHMGLQFGHTTHRYTQTTAPAHS
jgi:hypothetical protein